MSRAQAEAASVLLLLLILSCAAHTELPLCTLPAAEVLVHDGWLGRYHRLPCR